MELNDQIDCIHAQNTIAAEYLTQTELAFKQDEHKLFVFVCLLF